MTSSVAAVLQKIHFIERDIELQKTILAGLTGGSKEEIEQVVAQIAQLKEKAAKLKDSIQELDPVEYERIVRLEHATEKFRAITEKKTLIQVVTLEHHGECTLRLKDGTIVECLVMALDDQGGWTVLTMSGEAADYAADEVDSQSV